jgi:nitrate reductase assembly molybdenum cofactor insertion protein NarJ
VGEFLRFTEISPKLKKAVREKKLGYSAVTSSLLQLDKKQQDGWRVVEVL